MSNGIRWLRVRGLEWFLVLAAVCGGAGAQIGRTLSPVPGQLFSDVGGVPLVYFVPVVLGVAAARLMPAGLFWVETDPDLGPTALVLGAGCALAAVPVILVAGGSEPPVVAARNIVGTVALAALLRARGHSVSATTTAVLAPYLLVCTFGWDLQDDPRPWALPLLAPDSYLALGSTAAVAVGAMLGLRRLAVHEGRRQETRTQKSRAAAGSSITDATSARKREPLSPST